MSDATPPNDNNGSGSGPADKKDTPMESAAASGSGAPSSGTAGDSKDVAMDSAAPAEEEEDEDIRNSSAEELLMKSRMLDTEIKVGIDGAALCCRTSSRPSVRAALAVCGAATVSARPRLKGKHCAVQDCREADTDASLVSPRRSCARIRSDSTTRRAQ